MSKKPKDRTVMEVIDDINERLDRIEELASFSIRSNQRFKKGQRVKFSAKAYRANIANGRKGGVTTGRVVRVGDGFSMDVLLDGYKKPTGYHHSFFDPIGKK